jgi:hypothetical protein
MARPKDPELERVWRQRLQRQAQSGLAIAAFCAREGISVSSFQSWKRRLRARSLPAPRHPPLFVPLRLDPHAREVGHPIPRGIEIELPHQVRLRCDTPPDPEWLGRVVAALASLPHREAMP